MSTTQSFTYGKEKNSAVGYSVASGAVNGDGISDVIIGAPYLDARLPRVIDDAGATFVYILSPESGAHGWPGLGPQLIRSVGRPSVRARRSDPPLEGAGT
ncbi:MAG: FG-GAP repeat protein [Acidobacteria bacterium]|nr:FG-GAP repeat protein [Acidobacteriota bacterium]